MRSIRVERSVATAVRPSPRVLETAAMFGLGVDDQRRLQLVPPCEIPLPQGAVVFVTGPSGGGKSTILALIGEQCEMNSVGVIRFEQQPAMPEVPLVDVFDLPLSRVTSLLAMAGLGDAFVMLRCPCELSDGQRYRPTSSGRPWTARPPRSSPAMCTAGPADPATRSSPRPATMICSKRFSRRCSCTRAWASRWRSCSNDLRSLRPSRM